MRDFRQLKVWQKAHSLALAVYRASSRLPKHELYGLTSQIRRSCVSVPANIAEGCGRDSVPELGRFLQIAMGSATELDYHLLLARDLKFLPAGEYEPVAQDVAEVQRMLASLIGKLKADG